GNNPEVEEGQSEFPPLPSARYNQPIVNKPSFPLEKGRTKILSSRRVVGDPRKWNVIRDNRCTGSNNYPPQPTLTNKFQALKTEENEQEEYSSSNDITAANKGSMEFVKKQRRDGTPHQRTRNAR
ncbi:hypothetical protein HAX54_027773, partial [Datura stramonium]|nr:hypothetical protein [Datura stramonium]